MATALQPLRSSIYAFKTDFALATWIARLQPSDLQPAMAGLASAGFPEPRVRTADDKELAASDVKEPLNVVMDVEPRTPASMLIPGRVAAQTPAIATVLARAIEKHAPIASVPVPLASIGNVPGVVLAASVLQPDDTVAGFIAFSYRLGPLMLANDDLSLFAVALRDPSDPNQEFLADGDGNVRASPVRTGSDDPAPVMRTLMFGGRDWMFAYYPKSNALNRAKELAVIVGTIGLAVTAIICGLFGYVAFNNLRLSREIHMRIGYEHRLTAVIDELNHRVKNILAVIQSIVTRTLRHGTDVEDARELLIGRIHAMSNVVTLLSESRWQGVKLKGLLETRAMPHGERIRIDGPDISVSARAAQSLSLLFFELASHIDEGHSLVGRHPHVLVRWEVGDIAPRMFKLRWEEFNTSASTRRPDSEFAATLLDRVAPEALGGVAKRHFTDNSYVYELDAPFETVVDRVELERTEKITRPVSRS